MQHVSIFALLQKEKNLIKQNDCFSNTCLQLKTFQIIKLVELLKGHLSPPTLSPSHFYQIHWTVDFWISDEED